MLHCCNANQVHDVKKNLLYDKEVKRTSDGDEDVDPSWELRDGVQYDHDK